MVQKIVTYEQMKQGEPPCNYYDPAEMLASDSFNILPSEELIIVIQGCAYKFYDDTIHCLKKSEDDFYIPLTESQQICLLLKNLSNTFTIQVGFKTSLKLLLDMPNVLVKLCSCSITELTQEKLNQYTAQPRLTDETYANDETIIIK
jgi:hypothetical protein